MISKGEQSDLSQFNHPSIKPKKFSIFLRPQKFSNKSPILEIITEIIFVFNSVFFFFLIFLFLCFVFLFYSYSFYYFLFFPFLVLYFMLLTKLPERKLDFQQVFSPQIVRQATFGTITLYVQYLCDLWDNMLLHWPPITSHSTLSLGSRGFPQGCERP